MPNMQANIDKADNEIVVARKPPKKKLTRGGENVTFLRHEQGAGITTGKSTVVGQRVEEQNKNPWRRKLDTQIVKRAHLGSDFVREYEEEREEQEEEEKRYEEEEQEQEQEQKVKEEEMREVKGGPKEYQFAKHEEEKDDNWEEEEEDVKEISAKKWMGRYKWSEQLTDTYCQILVDIIRAGGCSDSGFKRPVWAELCLRLKKYGLQACTLTPKHCKDKYDNVSSEKGIKSKWGFRS